MKFLNTCFCVSSMILIYDVSCSFFQDGKVNYHQDKESSVALGQDENVEGAYIISSIAVNKDTFERLIGQRDVETSTTIQTSESWTTDASENKIIKNNDVLLTPPVASLLEGKLYARSQISPSKSKSVKYKRKVYKKGLVKYSSLVYNLRPLYNLRPVYNTKPVYNPRPVYNRRPVYKPSPVYKPTPVYKPRPVHNTTNHSDNSNQSSRENEIMVRFLSDSEGSETHNTTSYGVGVSNNFTSKLNLVTPLPGVNNFTSIASKPNIFGRPPEKNSSITQNVSPVTHKPVTNPRPKPESIPLPDIEPEDYDDYEWANPFSYEHVGYSAPNNDVAALGSPPESEMDYFPDPFMDKEISHHSVVSTLRPMQKPRVAVVEKVIPMPELYDFGIIVPTLKPIAYCKNNGNTNYPPILHNSTGGDVELANRFSLLSEEPVVTTARPPCGGRFRPNGRGRCVYSTPICGNGFRFHFKLRTCVRKCRLGFRYSMTENLCLPKKKPDTSK